MMTKFIEVEDILPWSQGLTVHTYSAVYLKDVGSHICVVSYTDFIALAPYRKTVSKRNKVCVRD